MFSALQRTDTQSSRSDNLRICLDHSLGFTEYPENHRAEPYLVYIESHCFSRARLEEYIRLFIQVVEHFKAVDNPDGNYATKSITPLLDELSRSGDAYFMETQAESQERRDHVEDTVLYIIGVWTMMLSSFVIVPVAGGIRKVTMAYNMRMQDDSKSLKSYDENVSALIKGSGLLPEPSQNIGGNGSYDDITQTALKLINLLSINPSSYPSCV